MQRAKSPTRGLPPQEYFPLRGGASSKGRKAKRVFFHNLKVFLIALTLSFLIVPSAFAQSPTVRPTGTQQTSQNVPPAGINLTVSPTFLNLVTDPGKLVNSEFRIRNNSNFTENLQVEIAKFEIVEGGKPVLSEVQPGDEFVTWVTLPEEQFSVSPNQTKTVRFSINPPEGASLGYYYALVINRVQEREGGGQGAVIAGSPALLTLLEVRSPNAKREVQLVDFKTDRMWYEYLPTNFIIRVKNTGNVHVVPSGNVFIDQGEKKDIAILAANGSHGNVLPQTDREFTASWGDGFAVREAKMENGQPVKNQNGESEYTVKYDFQKADKFRIGKYTANLLLVYDNGERDVPLEATVSFWVIPWKIIGIGLIIAIFVLIGVRSILMSTIRRVRTKKV
jgi:hypothetical protein